MERITVLSEDKCLNGGAVAADIPRETRSKNVTVLLGTLNPSGGKLPRRSVPAGGVGGSVAARSIRFQLMCGAWVGAGCVGLLLGTCR